MLSWTAFSQKDTLITLPIETARLIARDLARYDSTIDENMFLRKIVEMQHNLISVEDSLIQDNKVEIRVNNAMISSYSQIINLKNDQLFLSKNLNTSLAKEVKSKKRFIRILEVTAVGLLGYALLK